MRTIREMTLMAIWDNFRNAIRTYDDEYNDTEPEEEVRPVRRQSSRADTEPAETRARGSVFSRRESRGYSEPEAPAKNKMLISEPKEFGEAVEIADNLKVHRTVCINLEKADVDTARRILDFLSGIMYALGGKVKKVSSKTYILVPADVALVGDGALEFESDSLEL